VGRGAGERASETGSAALSSAPPPAWPEGLTRAGVARLFAAQATPKRGAPEAIGAYANGCLHGAVSLPASGPGYEVVRLSRARHFGHPELVAYVKRFARTLQRRRLGPLIVGDLSQARGGPTPTGHRSHQSGLDVDLWYAAPPKTPRRRLTAKERETLPPQPVADLTTRTLTPAWSPRMATVLELAASDPLVDRVFVHAAVKRALCEATATATAVAPRPWLARIRPWYGHHDHFHVRLKCPAQSPECEALDPILEEDDGCGEGLAWWFGDEPRLVQERRERAASDAAGTGAPPPLSLPARCAALLPSSLQAGSPTAVRGRGRSRAQ
jgi:penicillin-insensitive murein DD-endopeptidase